MPTDDPHDTSGFIWFYIEATKFEERKKPSAANIKRLFQGESNNLVIW